MAHLARLIRRHRLDYRQFEALCKATRKETGLRRPARSRRLPRVLPEATLRRYYGNEYLFESRHRRPYSTRRVQQIVQEYAEQAGISEHVHPHLFRPNS